VDRVGAASRPDGLNVSHQLRVDAQTLINLQQTTVDHTHNVTAETHETRMWANAQPDGRPAEHRWRPLFNAAKFG